MWGHVEVLCTFPKCTFIVCDKVWVQQVPAVIAVSSEYYFEDTIDSTLHHTCQHHLFLLLWFTQLRMHSPRQDQLLCICCRCGSYSATILFTASCIIWFSVIYFAVTFLRHIQHDEANTKTGILWYSHDEPSNKLTGEECAKKSARLVPSGPSTSLVLNAGTWALKMHRFTYSWSKIIVFKAPRRCNEIADVCCINIIYDTKMKHIISSALKINSGFPFRTRQAFLSYD